MEKLTLNYANIVSALNVQTQTRPRTTSQKPDKSQITCFNCQKKGHYSRECDLPPKKRKDANMVEVYSDLDSEDEGDDYEEVYATPKIRVTPYTTNRREAKERSKKTSESQQEMRLRNRNVIKPIPLNAPMDLKEGAPTSKVKKP